LRRYALPLYGLLGKRQSKAETAVISIMLNGEQRQVREGSIADLVASLGLDVKKVAVERNREIMARSTLVDIALAEGDALEIVHFVGGGC
jgi:thiazole synthase/sulfur carrier protein